MTDLRLRSGSLLRLEDWCGSFALLSFDGALIGWRSNIPILVIGRDEVVRVALNHVNTIGSIVATVIHGLVMYWLDMLSVALRALSATIRTRVSLLTEIACVKVLSFLLLVEISFITCLLLNSIGRVIYMSGNYLIVLGSMFWAFLLLLADPALSMVF